MKAVIFSIYMNNIDQKTVDLQRSVVAKFNKSAVPHYHVLCNMDHGRAIDSCWKLSGVNHPTFAHLEQAPLLDPDVVMFLDIDAIPVSSDAIDLYIQKAAEGYLVGNVQRSNHIQNDQHLFAAPSAFAISRETFLKIGMPTAIPSERGDVGEEVTFAAEAHQVPLKLFMPIKYELMPTEGHPWNLKDGQPVYGCQSTFGSVEDGPLFFHHFQIFHGTNQQRFWSICEKALEIGPEHH